MNIIMNVISKKDSDGEWVYLSSSDEYYPENYNDSISSEKPYFWTRLFKRAKTFESPEEAKIFWKVINDRLKIETDSSVSIRKIIFKKERDVI